jgi:hypothetical protein
MEVHEANGVCVPFGKCNGWPLESVIRRRFSVFAGLVRQAGRGGLYGELREAIETLVADPTIAAKLEAYKRQKKTEKINVKLFDNWVDR